MEQGHPTASRGRHFRHGSSKPADVARRRRRSDPRALALVKGPVVLVGHSWGGAVITEAGDDENVRALVYVAAFAPTAGSSLNEMLRDAPPPAWAEKLIVDKAGFATLPPDAIAQEFAQD